MSYWGDRPPIESFGFQVRTKGEFHGFHSKPDDPPDEIEQDGVEYVRKDKVEPEPKRPRRPRASR